MSSVNKNLQSRKFQFFDIIKENIESNEENKKTDTKKDKKSDEDNNESNNKLNINISSISQINDMQILDGVIFMNATITEKKKDSNKLLKIVNNIVIDEYIMFNTYYDFIILQNEKPMLIVFGSMRYADNIKQLVTSIKFYSISQFIEKKNERYPIKITEQTEASENYPDLLEREIRIYKKGNNNIVFETEGNKVENLKNLDKCKSFTVDSSLNYAAIALEKGEILIISAFPNLLECKGKKIKSNFVTLPEKGSPNIEITNLKMGEIFPDSGKIVKKILYVSTKYYLAYYEWASDGKSSINFDNLQCKFLKSDCGVNPHCLFVRYNFVLAAFDDNKSVLEFKNNKLIKIEKDENGLIKKNEFGNRNGDLYFDGKKNCILYFSTYDNDYIVFNVSTNTSSTINIYDNINNFFVDTKVFTKKVLGICADTKYIYAFVEEKNNQKYIVKLVEKDNKIKFDTFFSRKLYDLAVDYAKNLKFDEKLADIYKLKAEYEYSKGEFNKSIQSYIHTINYLDPSIVIQKFVAKSKMEFLIKYLEAIESDITFKQKSPENYTNYTTLLLNCYLMKEEIPKLKEFIEKKKDNISKELLKTIIDVCLETQNVALALSIAKSKDMFEDYLQILILKQNNFHDALDFIYPDVNPKDKEYILKLDDKLKQSRLKNDDRNKLFCKFGENFLKSEKSGIPEIFFNRVMKYIDENKDLKIEDKQNLFEIFVSNDQYYKKACEKMSSCGLKLDKNLLHRRIELYLEGKENDKIIEVLKNKEYIGKYDNEYLMMLFKYKNFLDGIEVLSELTNQYQELMSIYIIKREYDKIISLCQKKGEEEKSFWGIALNFFVDPEVRVNMPQESIKVIDQKFQSFLKIIVENKAILPVNILDIINKKNSDITLDTLRGFIDDSIKAENVPLGIKIENFNNYNNQITETNNKIKEIQTQASTIKLSKCESCFMGINFPAICFRCGHCFHTNCLNTNDENNLEDVDCPICRENKDKIKQQLSDLRIISEDVETKDKLNEVLDNLNYSNEKMDKFEFIHQLYGRGIIKIGPAFEDIGNVSIKEALSIIEGNK